MQSRFSLHQKAEALVINLQEFLISNGVINNRGEAKLPASKDFERVFAPDSVNYIHSEFLDTEFLEEISEYRQSCLTQCRSKDNQSPVIRQWMSELKLLYKSIEVARSGVSDLVDALGKDVTHPSWFNLFRLYQNYKYLYECLSRAVETHIRVADSNASANVDDIAQIGKNSGENGQVSHLSSIDNVALNVLTFKQIKTSLASRNVHFLRARNGHGSISSDIDLSGDPKKLEKLFKAITKEVYRVFGINIISKTEYSSELLTLIESQCRGLGLGQFTDLKQSLNLYIQAHQKQLSISKELTTAEKKLQQKQGDVATAHQALEAARSNIKRVESKYDSEALYQEYQKEKRDAELGRAYRTPKEQELEFQEDVKRLSVTKKEYDEIMSEISRNLVIIEAFAAERQPIVKLQLALSQEFLKQKTALELLVFQIEALDGSVQQMKKFLAKRSTKMPPQKRVAQEEPQASAVPQSKSTPWLKYLGRFFLVGFLIECLAWAWKQISKPKVESKADGQVTVAALTVDSLASLEEESHHRGSVDSYYYHPAVGPSRKSSLNSVTVDVRSEFSDLPPDTPSSSTARVATALVPEHSKSITPVESKGADNSEVEPTMQYYRGRWHVGHQSMSFAAIIPCGDPDIEHQTLEIEHEPPHDNLVPDEQGFDGDNDALQDVDLPNDDKQDNAPSPRI